MQCGEVRGGLLRGAGPERALDGHRDVPHHGDDLLAAPGRGGAGAAGSAITRGEGHPASPCDTRLFHQRGHAAGIGPQERENLFPGGLLQEYNACPRWRYLRMPSPRV